MFEIHRCGQVFKIILTRFYHAKIRNRFPVVQRVVADDKAKIHLNVSAVVII